MNARSEFFWNCIFIPEVFQPIPPAMQSCKSGCFSAMFSKAFMSDGIFFRGSSVPTVRMNFSGSSSVLFSVCVKFSLTAGGAKTTFFRQRQV